MQGDTIIGASKEYVLILIFQFLTGHEINRNASSVFVLERVLVISHNHLRLIIIFELDKITIIVEASSHLLLLVPVQLVPPARYGDWGFHSGGFSVFMDEYVLLTLFLS